MTSNKISENLFYYNLIKDDIIYCLKKDTSDIELILSKIKDLATFAIFHHPGFICDIDIDNILSHLPKSSFSGQINTPAKSLNIKVLHIATHIHLVGGHSRVILNWIEQDCDNAHYLFVTQQDGANEIFERARNMANESIFHSNKDRIIKVSTSLNDFILHTNPDIIILHIHPNDPIPLFVLSNRCEIPVIFFNHPDNVYCLGRTLNDIVINYSPIIDSYLKNCLPDINTFCLPLPVFPITKHASSILNTIFTDSRYFVTMGTPNKFACISQVDFFSTWSLILSKISNFKLIVIGVTQEDASKLTSTDIHPNIKFIGPIINPNNIIKNAEYFIEPFPVGSSLSTLESILAGTPPIFNFYSATIYGEGTRILFPEPVRALIPSYKDIENYITWILNEIQSNHYKNIIFPIIKDYVLNQHQRNWKSHINNLYIHVFRTKTNDRNINKTFTYYKPTSNQEDIRWINKINITSAVNILQKTTKIVSLSNKIKLVYYFTLTSIKYHSLKGLSNVIRLIQ